MALYELTLPKMGESVAEATIIKWSKNPGDTIAMDESVLEIATDKVDSEVPSPVAGKLVSVSFKENDVVQVGAVIAIIETEGGSTSATPSAAPVAATPAVEAQSATAPGIELLNNNAKIDSTSTDKFLSPLVKNIANTEGVNTTELNNINGTGAEGRITKDDILGYVANRKNNTAAAPALASVKAEPTKVAPPVVIPSGNDEIIEMDRMRKLIADHMIMSVQTSPHVTSFVEADVTNIVRWRERVKKDLEKRTGEKLTFTPIFMEAVAKAIRDFPMINVQVNGTQIIKKANINIGMAAALPSGNLIVPVVKNADRLNLFGLTKAVNDLANRARAGKLTPDEIQGGTYTLTNVGTFGNVLGTPIINQPQVAILAVGAIRKMPAVLETPEGDVIAIRSRMYLSHSYDHRVVDGALGGMFVRRVADYLEGFDTEQTI